MRILQVVGELAPERCGIAHYTLRLSQELQAEGVDVAISSPTVSAEPAIPSLKLRGSDWTLRTLLDLVAMARRRKVDWIHLQYAPGAYRHRRIVAMLPFIAKLVPGAPRIAATVHEIGGWPLRVPAAVEPLTRRVFSVTERAGWFDREALALMSMSDLLIVTNPDHLETLQARSPRVARRARMIPVGPNVSPEVDGGMSREDARRRLGVGGRFIAIFFGFVHPVKGLETLLQAMRGARAVHASLTLWITGGVRSLALPAGEADRYEARLRQMVAELGLSGAVEVTGYLPDADVSCRLRAADLAVLPFNHGVTLKSGSLVTCLSYGLPVLATAGGRLGPLRHGESIWLVPPRDPDALGEALCRLASDFTLRQNLGRAAAEIASEFSWSQIARRHLELLSDTREKHRSAVVSSTDE